MDRHGFIQSELELKTLVLYAMKSLGRAVSFPALTELALCDGAIDYFEYTVCFEDLVKTGHIEECAGEYSITARGRTNLLACADSLALPIRKRVDAGAAVLANELNRGEHISAKVISGESDKITALLSLNDDTGKIMFLELLAPDRAQANRMAAKFRKNAESFYVKLMEYLLEE